MIELLSEKDDIGVIEHKIIIHKSSVFSPFIHSAYLCLKNKVMRNNSCTSINLSSVELLPTAQGAALFSVDLEKLKV